MRDQGAPDDGEDIRSDGAPSNLRALRLRSQLLTGAKGGSPEDVVGRILAVQAQDERGCRLAVRSRSEGLSSRRIDDALTARRLVVTWLNRGTLHLVRSEDYWWLHPLTAPRTGSAIDHRLRQLGVTDRQRDRGVDAVVTALESEGPLVRSALRDRLADDGFPAEGEAVFPLLATASLRGLIVRGPMVEGGQAFVSVRRWLGHAPSLPGRQASLGRLAVRYLDGHGPASPEDLSRWSGVTLGDARSAFEHAAGEVRPSGAVFVLSESDLDHTDVPPTRLLGPFDPILHGWSSREMWVGGHRSVVTKNGIFRAVVLSEGRVKGTWRLTPPGIEVEVLDLLDDRAQAELMEDAADVYRFLGQEGPPDAVRLSPSGLRPFA